VARLCGHPLVGLAVAAARASGVFDTVCVSSDDDEVLAFGRDYGADRVLHRSAALSDDRTQVKEVCRHVLDKLAADGADYDTFTVLLATSPLRTVDDLRESHRLLEQSSADTVMSVVAWEHPPQRALSIAGGKVAPYFGAGQMQPAQALETLYRHDGTVIVCRTAPFFRDARFYGPSVVPYVVAPERSVDIDSPLDLAWAEFLVSTGRAALPPTTAAATPGGPR
jgi:CMP-N-acetylneuraminic acid synthetase